MSTLEPTMTQHSPKMSISIVLLGVGGTVPIFSGSVMIVAGIGIAVAGGRRAVCSTLIGERRISVPAVWMTKSNPRRACDAGHFRQLPSMRA